MDIAKAKEMLDSAELNKKTNTYTFSKEGMDKLKELMGCK